MSSTETEPTLARRGSWLLRRLRQRPTSQRLLAYALVTLVLGGLAALAWYLVVDLPVYTVESDGKAYITGIGLTRVFESDAWFSAIGVIVGIVLGVLAWRWFRAQVWLAPIVSGLGAALAGVIGWRLGSFMGPGSFDKRLAAAQVGDVIPISLDLRAPVVLALWVLFAELPILIAAMLFSDPEDQPPELVAGDPAQVDSVPNDMQAFVDFGETTSPTAVAVDAALPEADSAVTIPEPDEDDGVGRSRN